MSFNLLKNCNKSTRTPWFVHPLAKYFFLFVFKGKIILEKTWTMLEYWLTKFGTLESLFKNIYYAFSTPQLCKNTYYLIKWAFSKFLVLYHHCTGPMSFLMSCLKMGVPPHPRRKSGSTPPTLAKKCDYI